MKIRNGKVCRDRSHTLIYVFVFNIFVFVLYLCLCPNVCISISIIFLVYNLKICDKSGTNCEATAPPAEAVCAIQRVSKGWFTDRGTTGI